MGQQVGLGCQWLAGGMLPAGWTPAVELHLPAGGQPGAAWEHLSRQHMWSQGARVTRSTASALSPMSAVDCCTALPAALTGFSHVGAADLHRAHVHQAKAAAPCCSAVSVACTLVHPNGQQAQWGC